MKKILIGTMLLLSSCCPNYSSGERVGIVTKVSEKGLFFKSWEGEMLIALPTSVAGNTNPEKFAFNVDPSAVDAVKKAVQEGNRVSLVYRQWFFPPPAIDNSHVVYAVHPADK